MLRGVLDFITGRDIERRYDKIFSLTTDIRTQINKDYRAAVRLAIVLHDKHFPGTPFEPLDTVEGVITQIDNLTSCLESPNGTKTDSANLSK